MRSKAMVARPGGEDKTAACVPHPRPLHAPGSLMLVTGADARPAAAMKPGLY